MSMKISEWFNSLPKKFKVLVLIICAVVLLDFSLVIGLAAGNKKSALRIKCSDGTGSSVLMALNSAAKKGRITENGYAYYKFSEQQKTLLKEFYDDYDSVAILLRLKISPTTKQCLLLDGENPLPLEFGYLGENDFTEKGKFKKQVYPNAKRIVIQGDERYAPELVDISFALQRSETIEKFIPMGFFVRSALRCYIVDAAIVPSQIGFDVSTGIPFYAFGYNGGKIDFENKSFDFTGATMVFPVKNNAVSRMPEFTVKLSAKSEYKSTLENPVYADFNFGGEKIYIKNVNAASTLKIPAGALKAPFSRMDITANPECISSVLLGGVTLKNQNKSFIDEPIKTDPGLIQHYRQSNWRIEDYELFQWDRYPEILIFDTKDYDVQSKFFTRLAYFVEKEGFKGRLATDEELEGKHGYNAHDYKVDDLARFFNKAVEENFQLNSYELMLKKILINNGLFEADGRLVKPIKGEIASISRQTPDWSRTNLLTHELYHMVFFMDEEFRNYTTAVYHTCDSETLNFLIDYFKSQPSLGYDTNDQYLMYTEFMAYVMEQRTNKVAKSFVDKASWGTVMKFTPDRAAYIRQTQGRGFEDISNALTDFVFDKYGIVAGNLALITRY